MPDDPREPYGRIFHEQGRLTVNAEREKPFRVWPWWQRTDEERELDMRGASAVAAQAVHDAGLENAELRKRLMRWEVNGKAILEALSIAAATAEYDHQIRRYKSTWAALEALEGDAEPEPALPVAAEAPVQMPGQLALDEEPGRG
jgi:hypothetical protein